jgi:hypothetical protein
MVRGLVAVPAGYDRCRAFGSFGSARPISILWLGPLPPQTDTGAVPQIAVPGPHEGVIRPSYFPALGTVALGEMGLTSAWGCITGAAPLF